MYHRPMLLAFAVVMLAFPALAQQPRELRTGQLKRLLERFPQADANRDGTLTMEEAQAYRARMQAGEGQPPAIAPTYADIHFKAKMDALGIENVFVNGGGDPPTAEPPGGMLEFFKKHLLP